MFARSIVHFVICNIFNIYRPLSSLNFYIRYITYIFCNILFLFTKGRWIFEKKIKNKWRFAVINCYHFLFMQKKKDTVWNVPQKCLDYSDRNTYLSDHMHKVELLLGNACSRVCTSLPPRVLRTKDLEKLRLNKHTAGTQEHVPPSGFSWSRWRAPSRRTLPVKCAP